MNICSDATLVPIAVNKKNVSQFILRNCNPTGPKKYQVHVSSIVKYVNQTNSPFSNFAAVAITFPLPNSGTT